MTTISPSTLDENQTRACALACALTKVNGMIRQIIRNEVEETGEDYHGPLDGIDFILDCLIENCNGLATEFELMKYWAEDANIQITHSRFFGKETRLESIPYKK